MRLRSIHRVETEGSLCRPIVIVAILLLVVCSSVAAATSGPVWRVTSTHGPTIFTPGANGQYVILAYNTSFNTSNDLMVNAAVGGYTMRDELPAGVVATGAHGPDWDCGATVFPATVVNCTNADVVAARTAGASGSAVGERGVAPALLISVRVDATASAGGANLVTVSGGGAAQGATASDMTRISAEASAFDVVAGTFNTGGYDGPFPDGAPDTNAGGHPFEFRFAFALTLRLTEDSTFGAFTEATEHIRTTTVKVPAGFLGNPEATTRCAPAQLNLQAPGTSGGFPLCPPSSQIGVVSLLANNFDELLGGNRPNATQDIPLYNVIPARGAVADFAFVEQALPNHIIASLDPKDHYGVNATLTNAIELFPARSVSVTLWGVPADPAHDMLRFHPAANGLPTDSYYNTPANVSARPFVTLPSQCETPGRSSLTLNSWQHPDEGVSAESEPQTATDCDQQRFDASIRARPTSSAAGAPTGLSVDLEVPQSLQVPGRGTPPLRRAVVALPDGMTVSPSSADGLAGCSSAQIALGSNALPTCPDASKIGTVTLETPLLPDPVHGSVYLASQSDNPFGTLLALYIVVVDEERGLVVKLPGRIAPDPITGKLTNTFDDNPQLPFSKLHVELQTGPRAPLTNPATCGVKTTTAELTSWNSSLPPVEASDSFVIDSNCNHGFDPTFQAGTRNPVAGADTALITRIARSDSDDQLSGVNVTMPPGLLGRIADVPLCSAADAAAGSCPDASRIGTTTVAAGPGSSPFYITDGAVFITGPYKGAPFGLSILVHAKAGPFDLGFVNVRAQIQIDRTTAQLRVVSDPLPTILRGIPLQVRVVDVTIDRPHFTFNPTNCRAMTATAILQATTGATATKTSRFQVTDCSRLAFRPKFALRVGARGKDYRNATTPLTTTLRMPSGGANLKAVNVTLPKVLNARLGVVSNACTQQQFDANDCERARAGTITAKTPLLRDPLKGGAYFVKHGRPLPDLVLALRGQVDIDVAGKVTIPHGKQLSTNFDAIPDTPITSFTLKLVSGGKGPVGAATNLCSTRARRARLDITLTAQNGKTFEQHPRLVVDGCHKTKKAAKIKKHR